MVNCSDQVTEFIGLKVAVMGPFGLLWVIFTFMHHLGHQCIKDRLKLNYSSNICIYATDSHEWNNPMRRESAAVSPIAVQAATNCIYNDKDSSKQPVLQNYCSAGMSF